MNIEIERKYLVKHELWAAADKPAKVFYHQGYLPVEGETTVRVRLAGDHAFLTIKGPASGISRNEFEYEIPMEDAQLLLAGQCVHIIEKFRYHIDYQGKEWVVDEFLGPNTGLIMAEIELASEADVVAMPVWIGEEVSGDERYYNVNLAKHPYLKW